MAQITFEDKDKTIIDGIRDKWRDVDANEVKSVVNQKSDGVVDNATIEGAGTTDDPFAIKDGVFDPAGSASTAESNANAYTDSQLGEKANRAFGIISATTAHVLTAEDLDNHNEIIFDNGASAATLTIQPYSAGTYEYPAQVPILIRRTGSGGLTVVAGDISVVITGSNGTLNSTGEDSPTMLKMRTTNNWDLDNGSPTTTVPVKATFTEVNTGTDDAKFITPLGLQDSKYLNQINSKLYAVAGGTDDYTVAFTPAFTAFTVGQVVWVTFTNGNTGPVTLNPSSGGAIPVKKKVSSALVSGDIPAGCTLALLFNGTNLQVVGGRPFNAIANSELATMTEGTLKGNPVGASTTTPSDLSGQQVRDLVLNLPKVAMIFSDMIGGTSDFLSAVSGGSVSYSSDGGDSGHPGIATLSTGGGSSNSAALRSASLSFHFPAAGIAIFDCSIKLSALSGSGETYTIWAGINGSVAVTGNGAYFRYTDTVNGGRWECVTRQSSNEPADVDSGVAATTAFQRLTIISNAAGTSYDFYINGALVKTQNTNTPIGPIGLSVAILKSGGSTARTCGVDYIMFRQELTTSR